MHADAVLSRVSRPAMHADAILSRVSRPAMRAKTLYYPVSVGLQCVRRRYIIQCH